MLVKLVLSKELLKLAKLEVDTLFSAKSKLNENIASFDFSGSKNKLIQILNRSAMVKKVYIDNYKVWDVEKGRFLSREPSKKPAFHPTTLKPKLARLLVNLSGAKKEILDPFCGVGGILIEAAILGLKAKGFDIDSRAIEACKINLEFYGVKAEVSVGNATKLSGTYEAIATDPPYGRSSIVGSKSLQNLYDDFLASAHKVLRKNGRLAMIHPDSIKLKISGWKKLASEDLYVHRSLTRKIIVLQKI